MCKHELKNSDLLFKDDRLSFECIMWNFSLVHNLHVLVLGLKMVALARNCHSILGSRPMSFKLQTYPANLVWFLLPECLKSDLWLPNLDLNYGWHMPTYPSFLLPGASTFAW